MEAHRPMPHEWRPRSARQAIKADPICQEGRRAKCRTAANVLVTAADLYPGGGDAISWTADAIKTSRRLRYVPGLRWLGRAADKFDPTPDVGLFAALLPESLEFVTAGFAPTHAIEGSMQCFKYDKARIKAAKVQKELIRQRYRRHKK